MPRLYSNKNKMALPSQLNPTETVCIPVNVPNDPEWIGMFLGAIYRLSQQIWYDRDVNHSAKIVAARWQDVYLQTVKATWDCGALDLFDIRVNPEDDCSIQKTLDGVVWSEVFRLDSPCSVTRIRRNPATGRIGYVMEDFTFYEFPDGPYIPPAGIVYPEPKQRETSPLVSRCNGAYAAALALQMLYRETWGNLAQLATTGAFIFMRELADISSVVLGAVGLFDEYFNIVEDLAQESALFTDGGFPDSYLEDVQNILYCRSEFTDGAVYFSHADVITDFQARSASGPYGGLAALLTLWINEDALNSAGNIDAGTGDCSGAPCLVLPCSHTIDFTDPDAYDILIGTLDPATTPPKPAVFGAENYGVAGQPYGARVSVSFPFDAPCLVDSVSWSTYQNNPGATGGQGYTIRGLLDGVEVLNVSSSRTIAQNTWTTPAAITFSEVAVDTIEITLQFVTGVDSYHYIYITDVIVS